MYQGGTQCKSPIELLRTGPLEVVIRFPNRWLGFSPDVKEKRVGFIHQIRDASYPEGVSVYSFTNSISMVVTVNTDGCPSLQAEEKLETTVRGIVHEALVRFAHYHDGAYTCTPGGQIEEVLVSDHYNKLCKAAGVIVPEEFQSWTREELCRLPGINTDDVLIVERDMAGMGLFLKESSLPPFHVI